MRVPHNVPCATGPWGEWLRSLDADTADAVIQLAVRLLPGMVEPLHTRWNVGTDEAKISSALRIAARFYVRVGAITPPLPAALCDTKADVELTGGRG